MAHIITITMFITILVTECMLFFVFFLSTDPTRIVKNKFVDNNNGLYRGDSSSNYGRCADLRDNLLKVIQIVEFVWYHCQDWKVENNTFDGDEDATYGWYTYRYSYRTEFGNNTFREHNNKDIYLHIVERGQMDLNSFTTLIHR